MTDFGAKVWFPYIVSRYTYYRIFFDVNLRTFTYRTLVPFLLSSICGDKGPVTPYPTRVSISLG